MWKSKDGIFFVVAKATTHKDFAFAARVLGFYEGLRGRGAQGEMRRTAFFLAGMVKGWTRARA